MAYRKAGAIEFIDAGRSITSGGYACLLSSEEGVLSKYRINGQDMHKIAECFTDTRTIPDAFYTSNGWQRGGLDSIDLTIYKEYTNETYSSIEAEIVSDKVLNFIVEIDGYRYSGTYCGSFCVFWSE